MSRATPALPAVFLYPADDDLSAFAPKLLSLAPDGVRAQIARACKDDSSKLAGPNNGFIESSVLSRLHAELWAEGGKVIKPYATLVRILAKYCFLQVYLKDTKSTHGTYLNGERLSAQGVESNPRELTTGDTIVSPEYQL